MRFLALMVTVVMLAAGCAATHATQIRGGAVELSLSAPDAQHVFFACSLDGFQIHEAHEIGGRWVVSMPAANSFRYFYRVDGQIQLPDCKMREKDDFGAENCIFDPRL